MPKPVLQAMVLADHVYQDRVTGKFIIAGTFGSIWMSKPLASPIEGETTQSEILGGTQRVTGPVEQAGSPYLYVALADVRGRVPLRIRYAKLDDSSVLFEGQIEVTAADPVGVAEYCFPLPVLPRMIGSFSLDLLHDGEILGSWRVTIKKLGPVEHTGGNT